MLDFAVIALIVYCFVRGWCKGLLRTLVGPISLLLSCVVAVLYYLHTPNMLMAFVITIAGPILLNILFSFALNVWQNTAGASRALSLESRILGGGLAALWSGIHILFILVLIVIIPINAPWLKGIQENVLSSRTYSLVDSWVKRLRPAKPMDLHGISRSMQDPARQERIQSLDEYKAVMEDETLREILTDKEFVEAARNKDFSKLMTNPKMQAIFQDKKLLQKILDLNLKIMEQSAAAPAPASLESLESLGGQTPAP
ncbi:MAG: hypothetical protein HZA28_04665 [Candidatus Omnitrophica bacterium]|nr:hypothetical protein [Candidatus Omnitrophota bacterium]